MGGFISKVGLHLFHGFLGQAEDYKSVLKHLSPSNNVELIYHDLWKDLEEIQLSCSLDSLFAAWSKLKLEKIKTYSRNVLVGYSLGGRLVASLLQTNLDVVSQSSNLSALLISSHLGILDNEVKAKRISHDVEWSERFIKEDWQSVLSSWNSQSVLATDSHRPVRREENYNKLLLAKALDGFSLGKQKNYWSLTQQNRIHFMLGENDQKYLELYKGYEVKNLKVVPCAGHGVLFTHPERIALKINELLESL